MKPIALLDAPSNLGLRPPRPGHEPGVWRLPAALREQGILRRLHARDAYSVARLAYSADDNPETGFCNGPKLAPYTAQISEKIGELLDQGVFPFVLGGDCSILSGPMLALRRRGRFGLCFIDGHSDFVYARDPKWRGRYTAAGLDLALATGNGPALLVNIDGQKPYLREEDVVALGFYKDPADNEFFALENFYNSKVKQLDAERVRRLGATATAREALAFLEDDELKGFWIHLDTDVLHQSIMPAVDSPNPGGLTFDQLTQLLRVMVRSPRAMGLELTIFDPELDPEKKYAAALVDAVVSAFSE